MLHDGIYQIVDQSMRMLVFKFQAWRIMTRLVQTAIFKGAAHPNAASSGLSMIVSSLRDLAW